MSQNEALVSIGLPVFNGGNYVGGAIEALLSQSYENLELIISDNASTDRTEEVCRTYCARDRRIRYLRNPNNIGLLPNWRRVLDAASGDYFMWAACDDNWSPNYIETLLACLLQQPDAVLAAGRIAFVDPSGVSRADMAEDHAPSPSVTNRTDTARQFLTQHATNWLHGIYRREHLLSHSRTFFEEDDWGSDALFLLELCLAHEVVGSEEAVMYKRVFAKGPATPRKRVRWQCWFAAALLRIILKSPRSTTEKAEVIWSYVGYLKWMYFRKGLYSWLKLWGRAGYQSVLGVDRP